MYLEYGAIFSHIRRPNLTEIDLFSTLNTFSMDTILTAIILLITLGLLINHFSRISLNELFWKMVAIFLNKSKMNERKRKNFERYFHFLLFFLAFNVFIYYNSFFNTELVTGKTPHIIDDLHDALKYGNHPSFVEDHPYTDRFPKCL